MSLRHKRTGSARPLMVKRTPSVKSFSFTLPDSNKQNNAAKKASLNKEAFQATRTTARAESVSARAKSNFSAFRKTEEQAPSARPTKSAPTQAQVNSSGNAGNAIENNIEDKVGSTKVEKTPADLRIRRIAQNLAQKLQSTPSFSEDDRTGSELSCADRILKNNSPLIPHIVRKVKKPSLFTSLSLSDTVFASGQKPRNKSQNTNNNEPVNLDGTKGTVVDRITERSSKKSPVQHFTFPSIDTHHNQATSSSSTANGVAKIQYSLADKKSLQSSSLSVNLLSFDRYEEEKDSYIRTQSDEKLLSRESLLSDASSLSLDSDVPEEPLSPVKPNNTKQFLLSGGILRKLQARKQPEIVYEIIDRTVKEVNPFSTGKVKRVTAVEPPRPVPEEQEVFFWKPPGTKRTVSEITSLEIALTVASKTFQDMRREVSDQSLLSLLKNYQHCVEKDIAELVKKLVELKRCNKIIRKVQKEVKEKSDEFGEKLHQEMLERRRRKEQKQQKPGTSEPVD